MTESGRYLLGVWPVGYHERRHRKWLRLVLVVVVLAGAFPAVSLTTWLTPRLSCRDGWPAEEIWSQDEECVGVTAGGYAFELDRFEAVMRKIDEQNAGIEKQRAACEERLPTITVGVLATFTSPNSGGRAVQELEGFAAAQAVANEENACGFPIRLAVGNVGADEQAAEAVARRFRDDPDVLAVVGMGLSHQESADAADILGSAGEPVPMVASLITAEGFDEDGSRADQPDFSACADRATYTDGVGHGYFYRVAHRNGRQIAVLHEHLGAAPDLIVMPADEDDPYTCTALPLARRLGGDVQEVRFDTQDTKTLSLAAEQVCRRTGEVTVLYIARSRDLSRFLDSIAEERHNGRCGGPATITVASTSDAVRMRVPEIDPGLDRPRAKVLASTMFRTGALRLVYTPLADAVTLAETEEKAEFDRLTDAFDRAGFDLDHLDGGWAVNAYDALHTVAAAVDDVRGREPSRALISAAVDGYKHGKFLLGAGGRIEFDNSNNRTGDPVAVELCPGPEGAPPFTVVAGSGTPCR